MKSALKRIAGRLLGPYEFYRVYVMDPGQPSEADMRNGIALRRLVADDLRKGCPVEVEDTVEYAGEGADGFGAWDEDGRLLGACWFWHGERYARDRGFWPLRQDEAKLVQVTVAPAARGRGIGPALIAYACNEMRANGFQRLYARIWHNHHASRRAFEKAGWIRVADVIAGRFPWSPRPFKWVRSRRPPR